MKKVGNKCYFCHSLRASNIAHFSLLKAHSIKHY